MNSTFFAALSGIAVGLICIGFALAMACQGMWWGALSAACYGVLMIWLGYTTGNRQFEAEQTEKEKNHEH